MAAPAFTTFFSNSSDINTLQANIKAALGGYIPASGGQLGGVLSWAPAQTFPGGSVTVLDPAYPHTGSWATLLDHINDASVHRQPGPPIVHAAAHQMGGTDMLFGDQIAVSASLNTQSIKTYVDASIAAIVAPTSAYAPASYYAIGGAGVLYANTIAINAANPTVDVVSYVNTQIAAQVAAGGGSTTPSYTSLTISGAAGLTFTQPFQIISSGKTVLSGDGTNLTVAPAGAAGVVKFGTAAAYGTISASGYTIGATSVGPTGATVGGAVVAQGDIQVSRQAAGAASAGEVQFGVGTGAIISYGIDTPGFYVSKNITFAGQVNLAAGSAVVMAGGLTVSGVAQNATMPGVRSDGVNYSTYAKDGGSLLIGVDNATLANIQFGPAAAWGTIDSAGLHIGGSTRISAATSQLGGNLIALGSLNTQQSASSGTLTFGSAAAAVDFGVTANGFFSFVAGGVTLSQVKADGTYAIGTTTYGPTLASVVGNLAATKNVSAGVGLNYNGTSGFSFGGVADTGIFSSGAGDLRLVVGSLVAVDISTTLISFAENVNVSAQLSAASFTTQGSATIGGDATVSGKLYAGGSVITKFRTKGSIDLGYVAGAIATSSVFPNSVVVGYTGGQIEGVRLSCITADIAGTATSFNILKNGQVIATASFSAGATTAFAFPIKNPTPISGGDQLQAICTTAGAATGVKVILEISQFLI